MSGARGWIVTAIQLPALKRWICLRREPGYRYFENVGPNRAAFRTHEDSFVRSRYADSYLLSLPGKSGVGGGILAIVPGRYSLCVWSPGLDSHGNSVAGVEALDLFTTRTGLSVF